MAKQNKDKPAPQKDQKETADSKNNSAEDGTPKIDTLLHSLVFLTQHYGRAKSADAIKAGLAYDERGMGPQLFCEAADRLGFKAKAVKKDLADIQQATLPAVLILSNNTACILLGVADGKAEVFTPFDNKKGRIELSTLKKGYSGHAIYVQPRAEFVDPDAPQAKEKQRHWFWSLIFENKKLYMNVFIAAILINLFGLSGPLFIMNVYDRVIPNNAIETGWVLAIGALTVYLFDFIMRTLRGYFIDLAGRRVDVIASRRIYDHILNIKLSHRPPSSGAFANMVRDFESVRDFLTSATLTALVDLPFTLFFLFVIYMLGGPIAFILLFLIVFVAGIGMILQWPINIMVQRAKGASEAKHGLLVETISALETIKAIGADGRMRARYGSHVGESAAHAQSSRFVSALGVNIATMLQLSASIIIVLAGMYLVQDARMTMGALIACVILGGRALAPIGQVANLMARYHQARSSYKTLDDIMRTEIERPAHKHFLHRPDLKGKIAFQDIDFAYPGTERDILSDVSFTIKEGEHVGIIGRIGSGKSTLAKMMLGLYEPTKGTIYADDTDYRQIDPADLRRNIAYIAQDVVLFRGTVHENITISKPQASEEEVLNAAKLSGVHDFVSRHPMGYDAPVGERGEGLSGRQRQAIALARAILHTPNIMICDEPTNAMDVQAEEAFRTHIHKQIKGKTFVLITHRHHLLALVDRLILLDQGRVVIDGPRDKVIEALAKGKIEPETTPKDDKKK